MAEKCPLCGQFTVTITPSIARCTRRDCDMLTFRIDRRDDEVPGEQTGLDF